MIDKKYRFDIKRYQIISKINEGSYGTVHEAKEISTRKIYACKILKEEISDKTPREYLKNLIREVINISKSNHPAIIKFIGFSPTDNDGKLRPVIITEYLPKSLQKLFDDETKGISELDSTCTKTASSTAI